jgi:D-sedoheptulose 7-phosphate isomerase
MTTTDHVAHLREALDTFDESCAVLESWGASMVRMLTSGGRLLAVGNGGSAAQAQHLTAELVGRYQGDRRPFSAICLSAETSSLTAITNDYPPEELFARQVEAHGRPGDILVALSTSGSSPNIVSAAERARACGLDVWALTGPAPNPLAEVSDAVVAIDAKSTATVQEMHLVALHLLCEAFDERLAESDSSGPADDEAPR